jgi:hypothetical protein
VSSTATFVKPHSIGEPGKRKSTLTIKAPFVLTRMNARPASSLVWLWSRRGARWTIDQELRLDLIENSIPIHASSL